MVGGGNASVTSNSEYIGLGGSGTFVQSAGTNTVTSVFSVGELPLSIGSYTIGNSASLTSPELDIGFQGTGFLNQNGGTVSSDNFNVGNRSGSVATYTMADGACNATDLILGTDANSIGMMTQAAGVTTVTRDFSIAYYNASQGSYQLDGGSLSAKNVYVGANPDDATGGVGTFTQNGGSVNITQTMRIDHRSIARINGGTFKATGIDIRNARMNLGAGSGVTPSFKSVAISPVGRLDVNDNSFVVDYTGASPLGTVATPGSLTYYIGTAYVNGTWTGPGITSSTADAAHFAVGIAEASDVLHISGAQTALFHGLTVDATSVIVKFTYYGDANLNGRIEGADYSRIDTTFNDEATQGNIGGWFNGDFDYNGKVDGADYALIDVAFNSQSGTLFKAGAFLSGADPNVDMHSSPALQRVLDHLEEFGSGYATAFLNSVPEPSSASLAVICVSAVAARRRRRVEARA